MTELTSDYMRIGRGIEEKRNISFSREKWVAVAHDAY